MNRVVLNPGAVFAGYTIETVLGAGGMGTVYRAADPDLPRSVALKLLHRDLTGDEYIRAHFELEAAHAARLEHPNIVTVYRRGRVDDQLWIAMQYIDTTDAATAVASGPLDPELAVHIIGETAKALDYAHSLGVLHRDVKPANILLEHPRPGRPGRILLADFGIAKAIADTAHLTQTGMGALSLQYASPEQFDPAVELDPRTDVYSLGCSLFQLLTGELPYPGTTLPHLYAGHVMAPIPRPTCRRADLPPSCDAVIERALAKQRTDRYLTCGELASAAHDALSASHRAPRVSAMADQDVREQPRRPLDSTGANDRSFAPTVRRDGGPTTNIGDSRTRTPLTRRATVLSAAVAISAVVAGLGIVLVGEDSPRSDNSADDASQTTLPFADLGSPSGVAVDASGAVYVSYSPIHEVGGSYGSVAKLPSKSSDPTTLVTSVLFPTFLPDVTRLDPRAADPVFVAEQEPFGVAVDSSGALYVATSSNVSVLAPNSTTSTMLPFGDLGSPSGVAVDSAGNVYAADTWKKTVTRLARDGTLTVLPFGPLEFPAGLAVDDAGAVYVADLTTSRVLELAAGSASPTVLPFEGLQGPNGVAVDRDGTVYVADSGHNRVVSLPRNSTSVAQTEVPFTGLNRPSGVAVDSTRSVFVADQGNNRVVQWTP